MKKENGITLTALVIYIIVMSISIGIISAIIMQFYDNINNTEVDTQDILEVNKLNTYFLKEVKLGGNKIDTINNNYILFSSGNSFVFSNNQIYYNNKTICKNVEEFSVSQRIDGDKVNENVIDVTLKLKNFTKSITMNYKIEEIY